MWQCPLPVPFSLKAFLVVGRQAKSYEEAGRCACEMRCGTKSCPGAASRPALPQARAFPPKT